MAQPIIDVGKSFNHNNQGGLWHKNIGWALCSNDDVIISMTSLLLY